MNPNYPQGQSHLKMTLPDSLGNWPQSQQNNYDMSYEYRNSSGSGMFLNSNPHHQYWAQHFPLYNNYLPGPMPHFHEQLQGPGPALKSAEISAPPTNVLKISKIESGPKPTRLFTGYVTTMTSDGDFGFVDHEIFFHESKVEGGIRIKVGDYVLVEAVSMLMKEMPMIKWNCSKVQLVDKSVKLDKITVPFEHAQEVRKEGSNSNAFAMTHCRNISQRITRKAKKVLRSKISERPSKLKLTTKTDIKTSPNPKFKETLKLANHFMPNSLVNFVDNEKIPGPIEIAITNFPEKGTINSEVEFIMGDPVQTEQSMKKDSNENTLNGESISSSSTSEPTDDWFTDEQLEMETPETNFRGSTPDLPVLPTLPPQEPDIEIKKENEKMPNQDYIINSNSNFDEPPVQGHIKIKEEKIATEDFSLSSMEETNSTDFPASDSIITAPNQHSLNQEVITPEVHPGNSLDVHASISPSALEPRATNEKCNDLPVSKNRGNKKPTKQTIRPSPAAKFQESHKRSRNPTRKREISKDKIRASDRQHSSSGECSSRSSSRETVLIVRDPPVTNLIGSNESRQRQTKLTVRPSDSHKFRHRHENYHHHLEEKRHLRINHRDLYCSWCRQYNHNEDECKYFRKRQEYYSSRSIQSRLGER